MKKVDVMRIDAFGPQGGRLELGMDSCCGAAAARLVLPGVDRAQLM